MIVEPFLEALYLFAIVVDYAMRQAKLPSLNGVGPEEV